MFHLVVFVTQIHPFAGLDAAVAHAIVVAANAIASAWAALVP